MSSMQHAANMSWGYISRMQAPHDATERTCILDRSTRTPITALFK